jgi:DNA integrity scanning protein DisA with diadenylate cyclase activity
LGCVFCGFVIYFVGCMQVFLMTAISYVRYDILKKQKNEKSIGNVLIIKAVVISLAFSLFWSAMPIFGWSHYSLENGLVSCSVEYNEKSFNVISYNIGMFIFVFILPFGITIHVNIKSICIVKLLNLIFLN